MMHTMLSAKLHRARVTHSEVDYDGSCAIDAALLEIAGILEYEQIQIYNISNGERFTTYAIQAERGTRIISVNGAAAHRARPGDRIIICSYVSLSRQELANFKPTLVYLNDENEVVRVRDSIPSQVA